MTDYLATYTTAISALSYLAMACGLGLMVRYNDGREVYYVRFIDWLLTTPAQLAIIRRLSFSNGDMFVFSVVANLLMIICGWTATFVIDDSRWGFWVFGMICLVLVLYYVIASQPGLSESFTTVVTVGGPTRDLTLRVKLAIALVVFVWPAYGLIWALTEMNGDRPLCVLTEGIAYAFCDILSKVVFNLVVVYGERDDISRKF
jgi:bacteriorhodopsin